MQKIVLITGTSKGLGEAFAKHLLDQGYKVFGCARGDADIQHAHYQHYGVDLQKFSQIDSMVEAVSENVSSLDLVILNAGLLGQIKPICETTRSEIDQLMNVNVWANKVLLDGLFAEKLPIKQVLMISSGAAVRGSKGWGAYALSKATLNMLCQLYAAELSNVQFLSLAPGLIDTDMQAYLTDPSKIDTAEFPSIERLRDARGTDNMPSASIAAQHILEVLPSLFAQHASGDFVDVRSVSTT